MIETRIAESFSAAASGYDAHAQLQKGVAVTLADWLSPALQGMGVDLGCGTGPTAHVLQRQAPDLHWFAVDMAHGMLRELVARGRASEHYQPLQATATALPFADRSIRCLYSSFSLQWVADQARLAQELHRVLTEDGELLLALPLVGSLQELADAYQHAGLPSPLNRLLAAQPWTDCLISSGFRLEQHAEQTFTAYYADFPAVHRMIKGTGAQVRLQAARQRLGKEQYRAVQAHYEQRRQSQGLPVTWQVAFWRWQA